MHLKPFYALVGAAVIATAATTADAAVTFIGYQTGLNAGESLITSFEGGPTLAAVSFSEPGYALSGNGILFTGSQKNLSAAPGTSATTQDTTQYLSLQKGKTVTLTTPALAAISFYVGSLDRFNSFTFNLADGTTQVLTGTVLAALPGMDPNGSWTGFTSNGRLTFSFDSAITSVIFGTSTNSLEISDVGGILAAIPEPATWGMMILGFGGVGSLMRRRREMVFA